MTEVADEKSVISKAVKIYVPTEAGKERYDGDDMGRFLLLCESGERTKEELLEELKSDTYIGLSGESLPMPRDTREQNNRIIERLDRLTKEAIKLEYLKLEDRIPPPYGVCDSPEQFLAKFRSWNGYVWMKEIKRKDQPPNGGWRWHKWGEYVGVHSKLVRETEYLYDAKTIDSQYVFVLDNELWSDDVFGSHCCYRIVDSRIQNLGAYAATMRPMKASSLVWKALIGLDRKGEDGKYLYTKAIRDTFGKVGEEEVKYWTAKWKHDLLMFAHSLFDKVHDFARNIPRLPDEARIDSMSMMLWRTSIQTMIHVNNAEEYMDPPKEFYPNPLHKQVITKLIESKSGKRIQLFYNLTEAEQECLLEIINDTNALRFSKKQ